MITKFLLLCLLLIIACAFAFGLYFRLLRTAARLALLQKQLAANERKLQARVGELDRETAAREAK